MREMTRVQASRMAAMNRRVWDSISDPWQKRRESEHDWRFFRRGRSQFATRYGSVKEMGNRGISRRRTGMNAWRVAVLSCLGLVLAAPALGGTDGEALPVEPSALANGPQASATPLDTVRVNTVGQWLQTLFSRPVKEDASVGDLARAIAAPFSQDRWRVDVAGGDEGGRLAVEYRVGRHRGVGFSMDGNAQRNGLDYNHTVLGLQAWWETPDQVAPLGISLALGPMYSEYGFTTPDDYHAYASGWGVGGNLTLYLVLPIFSMMMLAPQRGWLPYLSIEVSKNLGWVGRMTNDVSADLDGDGVIDHVKGERFFEPDGTVRKTVYWQDGRVGLVCTF